MKISEKQLMLLMHILQDSLKMNISGYLSTSCEVRNDLLNQLLNQQSEELKEVGDYEGCTIVEGIKE